MNNQPVSLYDLIEDVLEISIGLDKVKSLFVFLSDYFAKPNPESVELLSRYHQYADLLHAANDIIFEQAKRIEALEKTLTGISSGEIAVKFHNT